MLAALLQHPNNKIRVLKYVYSAPSFANLAPSLQGDEIGVEGAKALAAALTHENNKVQEL